MKLQYNATQIHNKRLLEIFANNFKSAVDLDQATLFLWLCWNIFHQMKIDFLFWPWFFSLFFFQNPSNWLASNLEWLHFPPISPPNLWGRPSGWTQLLDSSYSGQTAKQHLAELLDLWKNTASFGGPGDIFVRIKKKHQGGVSNVHGRWVVVFAGRKWLMIRPPKWHGKSCEQYCFHDMICMYIYSMSFNTKTLWNYFLLGRFWYRRFDYSLIYFDIG